jgi:hypothetical protein
MLREPRRQFRSRHGTRDEELFHRICFCEYTVRVCSPQAIFAVSRPVTGRPGTHSRSRSGSSDRVDWFNPVARGNGGIRGRWYGTRNGS